MTTATSPAPFDARAFRNALGCFPTGVAVITTVHNGVPIGLTCNSFSSVSLEPPLVLWSLRNESKALEAFQNAGGFAINILAEDQNALSGHFASSKIADKFAGVGYTSGMRGIPLLNDCIARFECSTFAQHQAGDHVVFIGQVERFDHGRNEDPLVFYRGAYMMLTESLRELSAKGRVSAPALEEARLLVYGMLLRLAARNGQEADFDAMTTLLGELDGLTDPADMRSRATKAVKFFELIAEAAHNDVLVIVARSLTTLLHHQAAAAGEPSAGLRADLAAARAQIVKALRERNADGAVEALTHYANVVRPGH